MVFETYNSDRGDEYFSQRAEDVWNQAVVDLQSRFYRLTETLEQLEEHAFSSQPEGIHLVTRLTNLHETVLTTITSLRAELAEFATDPQKGPRSKVAFNIAAHTEILLSLARQVDLELATATVHLRY